MNVDSQNKVTSAPLKFPHPDELCHLNTFEVKAWSRIDLKDARTSATKEANK
jgi:hypothetical protein